METRYQRIAREQAERQAARKLRMAKRPNGPRDLKAGGFTNATWRLEERDRTRKARHEETYEDRLDDLGESPDY